MNAPGSKNFVSRGIHALIVLLTAVASGTVLFCLVATAGLYHIISDSVAGGISLTLPWLILLGAAGAIWKTTSYRFAVPLLGLSTAFLIYLAWDSGPQTPPLMRPKMVPADSKSYAAYRWLLRTGTGSRVKEASKPRNELPHFPLKREEWAAFVNANRNLYEEAWDHDTFGREWVETMAAHAPEGIYPNEGLEAPMLDFPIIISSARIRWAHAQILLLDNRADDAAQTLLPLLRVAYHLQQGSASLTNQMIAWAFLKGTHERLELIADASTLSDTTRTDIVAVLRESPPVPQNIALAFLGEEILFRSALDQVRGDYADAIKSVTSADNSRFSANRVLGRFLFNPKQSEREYMAFLNDSLRLAQQRQFSTITENLKTYEARADERHLKNPVGHLLAIMTPPAFSKAFDGFWKAEDQRIALLQRFIVKS